MASKIYSYYFRRNEIEDWDSFREIFLEKRDEYFNDESIETFSLYLESIKETLEKEGK